LYQIGSRNNLDDTEGALDTSGDERTQPRSGINAGSAPLQGTELRHSNQNTAPAQTGIQNAQKSAARRHAPRPVSPDYEKLLESFKPQSQTPPKKSKRDPPDDSPVHPDEMDINLHSDEPADYQTQNDMPLVMAATQVDLPEFNLSSLSRVGGDDPPDDF
jgi:hypothetical protein